LDVHEAIRKRRAYRALVDTPVSDEVVRELADAARLSPSALNRQPWRFVFVRDRGLIAELQRAALPDYNDWATRGSMFVAVCGSETMDKPIDENLDIRPYVPHPDKFDPSRDQDLPPRPLLLYDLGIASAFIILRATELGLVAHPIAGFLEADVRRILDVPEDVMVVALLIVGTRTEDPAVVAALPADLRRDEFHRPRRLPVDKIAFFDRYPAST
jgi:nitroreductase